MGEKSKQPKTEITNWKTSFIGGLSSNSIADKWLPFSVNRMQSQIYILTARHSKRICFPMQRNLELNHLKYFYFTVLEGGVQPAAERLFIQQPVVSKMLKQLEENL